MATENKTEGSDFSIVGIGASAGGLAAFQAFFRGMPADTDPGMAFVLVQHLAPDHESILAEILRRSTRLPVFEAVEGMQVRPNSVYIIPPNADLAIRKGKLQLLSPSSPRNQHFPIDFFFRSLADDQQSKAIGIVLSGSGTDGSHGIRAIKAAGGFVLAQSIASSEFDSMPRNAIETGEVDFELPPEEMLNKLILLSRSPPSPKTRLEVFSSVKSESAIKKIFDLLRSQTSHDFSQYKPSTIVRRIERRLVIHQIESLDGYVKYLQQNPQEVEALFRGLLIGVTQFFRDSDPFSTLETHVIPKLFQNKLPGACVRVWVAGCSTGEEAYSIAILLVERLEIIKQDIRIQIFTTDIDDHAIQIARTGIFPASIAADITPERLVRFFTFEPGVGYRINKRIRDLLIFSKQDILKDPPFSKIDLISCRNVMIYFNMTLQKKLIPLFHHSLLPNGFLFLGNSEGIGEFDSLFRAIDSKSKIYLRKEESSEPRRQSLARFLSPISSIVSLNPSRNEMLPTPGKQSLRELTEQSLLKQLIPVAAMVNSQGDVLYLHGRTGIFLEPAQGDAGISNILKMAREGLRSNLSALLRQSTVSKKVVQEKGIWVKTNGHYTSVDVVVRPVNNSEFSNLESPLYLIILVESPNAVEQDRPLMKSEENQNLDLTVEGLDPATTKTLSDPASQLDPKLLKSQIDSLTIELRAKDEYLQRTFEELESSNEELKSANEEMQSVNEELQSTNEELETSKEELQSVNEELATVNAELQTKVTDLSRINNDISNLLAGTGIGTVFVDFQLRILRFTPAVCSIINLILTDVGRPVSHIVSNLVGYDQLVEDTQEVLRTLIPKEIQVRTIQDQWYSMRIQPYRTIENVIEGAVISFVDITDHHQLTEALDKANSLSRLAIVVRDAFDAITVQDLSGRIIAWNPAATKLYGWSEAEALQLNARDRIPKGQQDRDMDRLIALSRKQTLEPYVTQRLTKQGECVDVTIVSTTLQDEQGELYAIATTERRTID